MFDWTEEAKQVVREGRANRRSSSEIAQDLGCTRNAVIGVAHRMKLKPMGSNHRRPQVVRYRKRLLPFIPEVAAMSVEPLCIALVDLENHHCREIVTPEGVTALFCGHPKTAGSSYCAYHHAINWMPARPERKPSLFRFGGKVAA